MNIDYSVIIRTTGKAGEKYKKLLQSIDALNPKPLEVIVVLPEGYVLPEERLGWERFCFCPKGMVVQRMYGIKQCRSQYALICDDDVQFDSNFIQKLHEPVAEGLCSFSIGPLYSFLPKPGYRALIDTISGAAVPSVFHKERYVSVLSSTGYSYNRNIQNMKKRHFETQSAAWTCFYANINALRCLDFETEQIWLDKNGYSAMDDQTMFYKAWLLGYKTFVVVDAEYVHLDAKTSTTGYRKPVLYASAFNRVIFWHRFIFLKKKTLWGKSWARLCFSHYVFMQKVRDVLKRMPKDDYKIKADGYRDGWRYLKTEEYSSLSPCCSTTK